MSAASGHMAAAGLRSALFAQQTTGERGASGRSRVKHNVPTAGVAKDYVVEYARCHLNFRVSSLKFILIIIIFISSRASVLSSIVRGL